MSDHSQDSAIKLEGQLMHNEDSVKHKSRKTVESLEKI